MNNQDILDVDKDFEYLQNLSKQFLCEAIICHESEVFLDPDEYVLKLHELLQCMGHIKEENIIRARDLLLDSILNLNCACDYTYINSLDLKNITE